MNTESVCPWPNPSQTQTQQFPGLHVILHVLGTNEGLFNKSKNRVVSS